MKFKLFMTANHVPEKEAAFLEPLGFKFKKEEPGFWHEHGKPMANVTGEDLEIQINTIEQLASFAKEYGELVVDEDSIEIYNDYRE